MTIGDAGAVITSAIAVGGVVLYIGRSLGKLEDIGRGVAVALAKTDKHDNEISVIKQEVTLIKTRQEDCEKCP